MQLAKKEGTMIGLSMMDIDHFKHVNDAHGHATGDVTLREFVARLVGNARSPETFGRMGGEEFLSLWTARDYADIVAINERFRSLIEESPFQAIGNSLPVTVSIGVTTTAGNETVDAAIARADRALYAAKESGRNRVNYDVPGFFERPVALAC
jgi:diguanylate cyclase (GGDEF)-like protein